MQAYGGGLSIVAFGINRKYRWFSDFGYIFIKKKI